jgi:hypothetical protein
MPSFWNGLILDTWLTGSMALNGQNRRVLHRRNAPTLCETKSAREILYWLGDALLEEPQNDSDVQERSSTGVARRRGMPLI